jgi:hypothetical protein
VVVVNQERAFEWAFIFFLFVCGTSLLIILIIAILQLLGVVHGC